MVISSEPVRIQATQLVKGDLEMSQVLPLVSANLVDLSEFLLAIAGSREMEGKLSYRS